MVVPQVGGVVVAARRSSVESSGPYSTVKGQVTLPQTSDSLLIVITTQHHAKVLHHFSDYELKMFKYSFVYVKSVHLPCMYLCIILEYSFETSILHFIVL